MTVVLLSGFYAVMAFSLAFAWFKGGGAEKVGVLLLLGFFLFRIALTPLIPPQFDALDPLAFAQDLIGFAGFVWIGLRARRYWPLAAAALQLISLSAHFARVIDVAIHPFVYSLLKSGPTLLVFLLLVVGTVNYRSRARAQMRWASPRDFSGRAAAPSWRRLSPRSPALPPKSSSSRFMTPPGATSPRSPDMADAGE